MTTLCVLNYHISLLTIIREDMQRAKFFQKKSRNHRTLLDNKAQFESGIGQTWFSQKNKFVVVFLEAFPKALVVTGIILVEHTFL